jgi:hypothetical protein
MNAILRLDAPVCDNIVSLVRAWQTRYGCAAPTSHLCHELGLRERTLELLVDRLVRDGVLAWAPIADPFGARDVRLADAA